MKDHVAMIVVNPDVDKEDSGVKGMRWGVRRTREERAAAAKKKGDAEAPTVKKPAGNIQDNVESSSTRYARLASEAKAGGASKMTEQDLKFFNARTDALVKINKLNETEPTWLSKTARKVLQTTAERQMQGLSDALANKYIGGPIGEALTGAAAKAAPVAVSAAKAASQPTTSSSTPKAKPPGMTREQTQQYFRDNPPSGPKPAGYSPSKNFDLFKELEKEGLLD